MKKLRTANEAEDSRKMNFSSNGERRRKADADADVVGCGGMARLWIKRHVCDGELSSLTGLAMFCLILWLRRV